MSRRDDSPAAASRAYQGVTHLKTSAYVMGLPLRVQGFRTPDDAS